MFIPLYHTRSAEATHFHINVKRIVQHPCGYKTCTDALLYRDLLVFYVLFQTKLSKYLLHRFFLLTATRLYCHSSEAEFSVLTSRLLPVFTSPSKKSSDSSNEVKPYLKDENKEYTAILQEEITLPNLMPKNRERAKRLKKQNIFRMLKRHLTGHTATGSIRSITQRILQTGTRIPAISNRTETADPVLKDTMVTKVTNNRHSIKCKKTLI